MRQGDRRARRPRGGRRLRGHARGHCRLRCGGGRRDDLEAAPDAQPLGRSGGRHQRGARERVRGLAGDPCLRHRQGLRLPRRPGRDRDPLRGGARRRLPARELGRRLLAHRGRPHRPAPVRRRRRTAHRLRGRHHGPRARPGALRAGVPPRHQGVRGVLRLAARRQRRPLPGRHLLGPAERRAQDARRQDRDPRHRRRRPALRRHDERLLVHGRRDGDGAPRRRSARGHGDDAVPPDDARRRRAC